MHHLISNVDKQFMGLWYFMDSESILLDVLLMMKLTTEKSYSRINTDFERKKTLKIYS